MVGGHKRLVPAETGHVYGNNFVYTGTTYAAGMLRTTTSAVQSTSSEEMAMLKQPMIEKLAAMRLLG